MRYRRLGKSDIEVSEIGVGAWAIGGSMWGGADDAVSRAALESAADLGVNFVDTALAYGDGHSERVVGTFVRARKTAGGRPMVVATKVPPANWKWPAAHESALADVFPRKWIRKCTEDSLRNLGLERIDLQQLHVWSPRWAAGDEWHAELDALVAEGKVRAFGLSINDHEPDTALEVIATGRVAAVQVIYNVFDQSPEDALLPACARLGVGVLARVPLDEGSLTGKLTRETRFASGDWRSRYFGGGKLAQAVEHAEKVRPGLEGAGGSMAEGALRFCLSHPAVSSVIPGIRTPEQATMNAAASDRGPLDDGALGALRAHRWVRNFYGGLHD